MSNNQTVGERPCAGLQHYWRVTADAEGDTCNCGAWSRFHDRIEKTPSPAASVDGGVDEWLQAIRDRERQATEAPWIFSGSLVRSELTPVARLFGADELDLQNAANNGAFIAHAREDVPFLLEQLNMLQAVLDFRVYSLEQVEHALVGPVFGYETAIAEKVRARIGALERYVQHTRECPRYLNVKWVHPPECTCGLTALLASPSPSEGVA